MPRLRLPLRLAPVLASALVLSLLAGCGGKPTNYPVTGTVKLKGQPVEGCRVVFAPTDSAGALTVGAGGSGLTDKSGKFEITNTDGEMGVPAGKYKVALIAWVSGKTGKPVPSSAKPSEVEGGVKSIFGDNYEDPSMSPETVEVTKGGVEKTFDISK